MLKKYRVFYTESEHGYSYTGEWYDEISTAETAEEAIELLKAHFTENGGDPNDFIYRIGHLEAVTLYGLDEKTTVYMEQETFIDPDTGYEIYIAEDGRWVAEDDAIGEWVQVKPC